MVVDTLQQPVGKQIIKHPDCAIVDFTGSIAFGRWVEQNAWPALAFTETAGCNTVGTRVVLPIAAQLEAAIRSLATTASMFSAQMCTSPQNFYIPADGVTVGQARVPFQVVAARLAAAVAEVGADPRRASMILACIQSDSTLALVRQMHEEGQARGEVLLRTRYLCAS